VKGINPDWVGSRTIVATAAGDIISALIDLAALTAWMPRVDPGKSLRRRPANQGEMTSADDGVVALLIG